MTNEEIHQQVREMTSGAPFSTSYVRYLLVKADAALLEAEAQVRTLESQLKDEQVILTTQRGLETAMAAMSGYSNGTVIRVTDGDRAEYELQGSVWLPRS